MAGKSTRFDRLSANAAAESEGARTRRLLSGGPGPKRGAGKGGMPAIPGAMKGKPKPTSLKLPDVVQKGPASPASPGSPSSSLSLRSPRSKNAFAIASTGGRLAARQSTKSTSPQLLGRPRSGLSPRSTALLSSRSMRSPRDGRSPRDSRSPREGRSPRGAGLVRGGVGLRTVSRPAAPPNPGGVLQYVLSQVFPEADQRLAVTLRLAHCGIFSAAELWYAIATPSDAHFYKIPKPFTYERKARLVNELVVQRTAQQDIFPEEKLVAMMGLLEAGKHVSGEPKSSPANEIPMDTQMHCALLCCDVLGLRRKLMRIGTRTTAQFAEAATGLESTALFQLEINKQLKKVGERPVGKDTLEAILAYSTEGTEFAKLEVERAEKNLRAELAPLKVGAVITRAADVDGIELEKLDEAQDKAGNDETKVKAAVIQMVVDANRPTPCPVPMYGDAGTAWLSVEASESAEAVTASMSSVDCVWLKGELPIIIGLPYGCAEGEPGLWELTAALRERFLETSARVPHIIVSTKPRAELDCSVQFSDLTSPSEGVMNAWKNYHTLIETAKGTIKEAGVATGADGKPNDTAVFIELCSSQATEGSEAALCMCHIGYRVQPRMISKCVAIVDGEGGQPVDKNDPEVKAQIESAFNLFDIDGSGDIDSSELAGVAKELGVDMTEDEVAVVMATIDEDGGGDIDLGEFTNWFLGLDKKEEGEKISKIGRLKMMSMLAGSSVEGLCKRAPGTGAPVEAMTSGASLGAHMESFGFSAVPSLNNKDPAAALQAAGVSEYNFGGYSLDAHGSADGAGNVDAIGIQLPASCWTKAPAPPKEMQPNPWLKEAPSQASLGSPAKQWGHRLADSIVGFASVNCGQPLFIAPGSGSLRGPKQKTKLNPFGFQK